MAFAHLRALFSALALMALMAGQPALARLGESLAIQNNQGDKADQLETERLAAKGDGRAQRYLGIWHWKGLHGYDKNKDKAVAWFAKGAANGDTQSQLLYGLALLDGVGVKRDPAAALPWMTKAAEAGDSSAQNYLGLMYVNGTGVAKDEAKAIYWLEKSVQQGDADGQFNLGVIALNGYGMKVDEARAAQLFRKSAEQGNADAQHNLGWMLMKDEGDAVKTREAMQWLEKAAMQGDAMSQLKLARGYFYGVGVPKNYDKALEWANKALAGGEKDAHYTIALVLLNLEPVTESNYRQARMHLVEAVRQDIPSAKYLLSLMLQDGDGGPKDESRALVLLREAAQSGHAKAQFGLGRMYARGSRHLPRDLSQALVWFGKSAEQGNSEAQYHLGLMYANGIGVKADQAQARQWLEKAAANGHEDAKKALTDKRADAEKQATQYMQRDRMLLPAAQAGDATAQYQLGMRYEFGNGVKADLGTARTWYEKAANQGYAPAQTALGVLLATAAKPDFAGAAQWYEKAAAQGDTDALGRLAGLYMFGNGVPRDEQKGFALLKKSAEGGNRIGQFRLGYAYWYGMGTPVNKQEAIRWYQAAAEQNFPPALRAMGMQYLSGALVAKDADKGLTLLTRAAQAGDEEAQYVLGRMYYEGDQVKTDWTAAHKWLTLAAKQKHTKAAALLVSLTRAQAQQAGATQPAFPLPTMPPLPAAATQRNMLSDPKSPVPAQPLPAEPGLDLKKLGDTSPIYAKPKREEDDSRVRWPTMQTRPAAAPAQVPDTRRVNDSAPVPEFRN